MASDVPWSFDAAEADFSRFLTEREYPALIAWIAIEDVIIDESGQHFVRRNGKGSRATSKNHYLSAIGQGLGIELRAMCASEAQTFASLYVPVDVIDAQYRMIAPGLKMSCPEHRLPGILVSNPFRWWFLKRRNGKRSAMLQHV